MLSYRQKRNLFILDFIIMIITFLGVIITTSIVIIVNNDMRNIFIGELFILIIIFANSVNRVSKYLKSNKKVSQEYVSDKTLRNLLINLD